MVKKPRLSVAQYLTNQIASCAKPQTEIAAECGYKGANIISMFKKGLTKVPVGKAALLAKSIGTDPTHLLDLVMSEYYPEAWDVVQSVMGNVLVTDNERKIIELVRATAAGQHVAPETKEDEQELQALIMKWKSRSDKRDAASVERFEREKRGR